MKPKKEKKIVPSKAPVRVGANGVGFEGTVPGVPSFPIEMTPEGGIRLGGRAEKDLKDGESVHVISHDQNGIGIIDRRYHVKRLEDNKLELTPMGDPKGPQEIRDQLARAIVADNRKAIREEVTKAVEDALKRKDIPTLTDLKEASDRGKKLTVTSRQGCMYMSIGKRSVIL